MSSSVSDKHQRFVIARAVARMSRPDQVVLVAAVYGLGVAAASASGADPTAGAVLIGLVAVVLTGVSVHVINEYADVETDAMTHRSAFSGGSGALQRHGLAPRVALRAAAVAGAAALAVTLIAVARGSFSPTAALIVTVGLVGGWQYSVGPLAFSRRGLGEIENAVLGGLLLPFFGFAVVADTISWSDAVLFLPFAFLAFVNLLETQWPDREADGQVGKRTLVTRVSPRSVRLLAAVATLAAYLLLLSATPAPIPVVVTVGSLAAVPLSAWALMRMTRVESPMSAVLAMLVGQGAAWTYLAA